MNVLGEAAQGRYIGVPLEVLTTPRDGESYVDRWWCVVDGAAVFWQRRGGRGWTPQCNADRRLPDRLAASLYPGATVEHVDVAYLGPWNEDYGYALTPAMLDATVPAS